MLGWEMEPPTQQKELRVSLGAWGFCKAHCDTVQANEVQESNTPALLIQRVEPSYDVEFTKRYALVLFNTDDREGALDEACNLCLSLIIAGFDVVRMEWTTTDDLTTKLRDLLNRYSTGCGLFFVSIMSHGKLGTIKGSSDSEIAINDILLQLTNNIKDDTPLVSLVKHL